MSASNLKIQVQARGEGRPLVLLHAYPLSHILYDKLLPPPQTQLILPDFPGFGSTPWAEAGWTLEDFARSLQRALEDLGVRQKVVLGGVSMGGYGALEYVRLFPDQVEGLLLAGTKAGLDEETARFRRLEVADKVEREGTGFLLKVMPNNLLGATTIQGNPALLERVRDCVRLAPPRAVAGAQRAMAVRRDQSETLRVLRVPALWLAGAEDQFVSTDEARQNASLSSKIRLQVLDQVGHLVPWESPDQFQNLLNEFVGTLPG